MRYLTTIPDVCDLSDVAGQIRGSSNFRFNWQFFRMYGFDPRSPIGICHALESIIAEPELHQFLHDSFQNFDDESFSIDPLHVHCLIADSSQFEAVLAAAANDRLGAYSRERRQPTAKEAADLAARFVRSGITRRSSCDLATRQAAPGAPITPTTCSRPGSSAWRGTGACLPPGHAKRCSGWAALPTQTE